MVSRLRVNPHDCAAHTCSVWTDGFACCAHQLSTMQICIDVCVMFSCFSMFPRSFKKPMVLALGDCIPVRPWSDSPIACLAELRMVWRDKSEQCLLTSLRLYFLPENTPMGRYCHGEVSTMHQCSVYNLMFGCLRDLFESAGCKRILPAIASEAELVWVADGM